VVNANGGTVLRVPVSVTASGENLSGLAVAVTVEGRTVPGTTAVRDGAAVVSVPVPVGACVGRVSLTLERGSTPLRLLDLYLKTSHKASCHVS
jgi:hypothetical protein